MNRPKRSRRCSRSTGSRARTPQLSSGVATSIASAAPQQRRSARGVDHRGREPDERAEPEADQVAIDRGARGRDVHAARAGRARAARGGRPPARAAKRSDQVSSSSPAATPRPGDREHRQRHQDPLRHVVGVEAVAEVREAHPRPGEHRQQADEAQEPARRRGARRGPGRSGATTATKTRSKNSSSQLAWRCSSPAPAAGAGAASARGPRHASHAAGPRRSGPDIGRDPTRRGAPRSSPRPGPGRRTSSRCRSGRRSSRGR